MPLGASCYLYRNTGTNASPTWNLVPNVGDLSVPISFDEADVSTRESLTKMTDPGLMDASIQFSMIVDSSDTDYVAIELACFARTAIEFAVMNGPIGTVGSRGLRAFCKVLGFEDDQGLSNAQKVAVTLKPTRTSESGAVVAASWLIVAA